MGHESAHTAHTLEGYGLITGICLKPVGFMPIKEHGSHISST